MLQHRYPNEPYANIGGNHYASLDSCSHMLERTYIRPSKNCHFESYQWENKYNLESNNEANESQNIAATVNNVVEEAASQETKCNKDDEIHKNAIDSTIATSEQNQEAPMVEASIPERKSPQIANEIEENNLAETSVSGKIIEDERVAASTNTAVNERLSDDITKDRKASNDADHDVPNEQSFRLPGFHQAFGSTEIGRFGRPTIFTERIPVDSSLAMTNAIDTNPIIHSVTTSGSYRRPRAATMVTSTASDPTKTKATSICEVGNRNVTKARSRCGKRIKAASNGLPFNPASQTAPFATTSPGSTIPTSLADETNANHCRSNRWNYMPEDAYAHGYNVGAAAHDYKRRNSRTLYGSQYLENFRESRGQNGGGGGSVGENAASACYYNSNEYNYYSPSSYYNSCEGSNYTDPCGGSSVNGEDACNVANCTSMNGGGAVDCYGNYDCRYYQYQRDPSHQSFSSSGSPYANCDRLAYTNDRNYRLSYLSSSSYSSSLSPSPSPSSFSSCSSSSLSSSSSSSSSSSPLSSSTSSLSSLFSSSSSLSSSTTNRNWRADRYFPYGEMNAYGSPGYGQPSPQTALGNSSPYGYNQRPVAQNQHLLQQPSSGVNSNGDFNSYHRVASDCNNYC